MLGPIPRSLFAATLLVSIEYAPAAPVQWPAAAGGSGNTYDVIVTGLIPWSMARQQAESLTLGSLRGRLATINSAAENEFLAATFGDLIRAKWLGGFQPPGSPEPAGNWQWITGEPFIYANWEATEPNNSGGSENNLCFATAGGMAPGVWNDLNGVTPPDTFVTGYVVEYVPEPRSLALLVCGLVSLSFGRVRRPR